MCSPHSIHVLHHAPQCLDMGAIVNETQRANIQKYVDLGVKEGADVFQIEVARESTFLTPSCPAISLAYSYTKTSKGRIVE